MGKILTHSKRLNVSHYEKYFWMQYGRIIEMIICHQSAFVKILFLSHAISVILGKLPNHPRPQFSKVYITNK